MLHALRHDQMGAHSGPLAAQMRERRPVGLGGAPLCQLGSDEGKHSNPKSERQALRAYRIYSRLRLAEVRDPAIRFNHTWKRQVDWAFASFYRSFERLVADDRVTQ